MIKIREIQKIKDSEDISQQRILDYKGTFEDYKQKLTDMNKSTCILRPSLPRLTNSNTISESKNKIVIEFIHRITNDVIVHVGELVE